MPEQNEDYYRLKYMEALENCIAMTENMKQDKEKINAATTDLLMMERENQRVRNYLREMCTTIHDLAAATDSKRIRKDSSLAMAVDDDDAPTISPVPPGFLQTLDETSEKHVAEVALFVNKLASYTRKTEDYDPDPEPELERSQVPPVRIHLQTPAKGVKRKSPDSPIPERAASAAAAVDAAAAAASVASDEPSASMAIDPPVKPELEPTAMPAEPHTAWMDVIRERHPFDLPKITARMSLFARSFADKMRIPHVRVKSASSTRTKADSIGFPKHWHDAFEQAFLAKFLKEGEGFVDPPVVKRGDGEGREAAARGKEVAAGGSRQVQRPLKPGDTSTTVPKVTVLADGSKMYRYNCVIMKLIKGYDKLPVEERIKVKRAVKDYLVSALGWVESQECIVGNPADPKSITYVIPERLLQRFAFWLTEQMRSMYQTADYPFIEVVGIAETSGGILTHCTEADRNTRRPQLAMLTRDEGVAVAALLYVVLVALPPSVTPWLKTVLNRGKPRRHHDRISDELTPLLEQAHLPTAAEDDEWQVVDLEDFSEPSPAIARFHTNVKTVCNAIFVLGYLLPALQISLAAWAIAVPGDKGPPSAIPMHWTVASTTIIVAILFLAVDAPAESLPDVAASRRRAGHRLTLTHLAVFFALASVVWGIYLTDAISFSGAYIIALSLLLSVSSLALSIGCMMLQSYVVTGTLERKPINKRVPNPELDASLFSYLTFSWFNAMMARGSKRTLKQEDLYEINRSETTAELMTEYDNIRRNEKKRTLLQMLWRMNWRAMLMQYCFVLAGTALFFSGPILLNRLLTAISNPSETSDSVAYACVFLLFVCQVASFVMDSMTNFVGRKIGIRIKVVLTSLIYRKSLRRVQRLSLEKENAKNSSKNAGASVGKIVSLMSADASAVGNWVGVCYMPIITLTQVILCIVFLFYILSWPALAGVIVLTLLMFSGSPLASRINKAWADMKRARDRRVNAMNEILQGIKIIKLFAWESQFKVRIRRLREEELDKSWRASVFHTFNKMLWYSAPSITTLVTLGFYTTIAGQDLTPTVAFTTLSLFNLLKGPLQLLPDTITNLLDVWVSIKRIGSFLQEDELEKFDGLEEDEVEVRAPVSGGSVDLMEENGAVVAKSPVLGFRSASFEWDSADHMTAAVMADGKPVKQKWWQTVFKKKAEEVVQAKAESGFGLRNLDVVFPQDKLSVVVGATGCGKSSLLLALIGEMKRTEGTRFCPTTVAYVPQIAWLGNATIRENILFGEPFDAVRYRRVIAACALIRDFETLDGGDKTEVGEKGINLSGGQKQRISLARAAYSRAKYVLLDDCLSAVDAPTARHLYEDCILGLLGDRTRVLVTNAAGLTLPRADYVIVMQSGEVALKGTVEDVFSVLKATPFNPENNFLNGMREMTDLILSERARLYDPANAASIDLEDPTKSGSDIDLENLGTKLVEKESIAEGSVSLKSYYLYYVAIGGFAFIFILLCGYAANHGTAVYLDVIVSHWSDAYIHAPNASAAILATSAVSAIPAGWVQRFVATPHALEVGSEAASVGAFVMPPLAGSLAFGARAVAEQVDTKGFMIMYALVTFLCVMSIMGRLLYLAVGQMVAGRRVHENLMDRIMNAPVRFFEVTPIGRIMNRFTKDVPAVDREVGTACANMTYNLVFTTFIVGSISGVVPGLLVAFIPIAYVYLKIGQYYIKTSRALKRIDSVVTSPIFAHFSETLSGVTVIRAFNAAQRFTLEFYNRNDTSNRSTYFLMVAGLWLSIRIQTVGSLILVSTGLLIITGKVGPAFAGLCINFALQLTDTLIAMVRQMSWLEMSMNSVERCQEYLELEQEAPAIIDNHRPPSNWPSEGRILIDNLVMKYAPDLPEVLKGISADIGTCEKVGIVGRTGAGKSSLTLAFLRAVEPASGTIVIDGVDIRQIGLRDLRSNITIIPQDPILFAGTVRSNLDPFLNQSDADLWAALKRARLSTGMTPSAKPPTLPSTTPTPLTRSSSSQLTMVEDGQPAGPRSQGEFSVTLDTIISEGGANLSAGQRQLLCLARSLAKKSKVIMLDEATASVDTETDARIQDTIRNEFYDCTVLTIAHRLKTVADYDRIIVLDNGEIIENGSPLELMEQSPVNAFRAKIPASGMTF
ncbi:hypothetical protein HK101_011253 [Irineochytrium annulatum]|nr:hypothetical protein HK101_011253 [Irineochytrium annulatum]